LVASVALPFIKKMVFHLMEMQHKSG